MANNQGINPINFIELHKYPKRIQQFIELFASTTTNPEAIRQEVHHLYVVSSDNSPGVFLQLPWRL